MKIVIKAENRKYPDNIGDYLWQSIKPAADQLGIDLVRLPVSRKPIINGAGIGQEIDRINDINPDLFIFFSNWVHGRKSRKVAAEYNKINCPVLFWSREDPNHYGHFLSDTRHADIIGTCCSDCIPKYEAEPTRKKKKVISLPMAVAPEIFYPPESEVKCDYRDDEVWYTPECRSGTLWGQGREDDENYRGEINENYGQCPQCHGSGKQEPKYSDREWDIVFLGNRYVTRKIRNDAEAAVIIAAAKWATANGKKMGVWGHDGDPYGWWQVPEIYNTGIYQGRVDRIEAADVYRNAKVALSVSSNDYSPTMAPNRVVQIAACGTILIAYKSIATWWQTGEVGLISYKAEDTEEYLRDIFKHMKMFTSYAGVARAHVLEHHTFKHRLQTIMEAMK